MAINSNNIDKVFKQNGDSCLLSSFAITGNYFTNEQIRNFFEGYFLHFESEFQAMGVTLFKWPGFEILQGCHINLYTQSTKQSGYKVLFEEIYHSNVPILKKCRNRFKCERISIDKQNGIITNGAFINRHVNDILLTEESIINIFLNSPKGGGHSIVIYFDQAIYYHDTVSPAIDKPLPQDWWCNSNFGDTMISWKP